MRSDKIYKNCPFWVYKKKICKKKRFFFPEQLLLTHIFIGTLFWKMNRNIFSWYMTRKKQHIYIFYNLNPSEIFFSSFLQGNQFFLPSFFLVHNILLFPRREKVPLNSVLFLPFFSNWGLIFFGYEKKSVSTIAVHRVSPSKGFNFYGAPG